MATKKQLIGIKGISEVKAEKMLKAAREMVNVGFTTVRLLYFTTTIGVDSSQLISQRVCLRLGRM